MKIDGVKMNKARSLWFLVCTMLFFLPGCAQTQRYEAAEQICVPDSDKLKVMQIAEDVLSRMHFTIDKADAERGVIRTRPLPGAQFFEFWRSDSVGAFSSAEANLHSIRRIVDLDISDDSEQLCITCDVRVQRLSIPEHYVSSSSRAYEMFSESSSSMQELRLRPEQKEQMAWLDLGEDRKLATVILKQIEEQITVPQKEKRP